MEHPTRKHPTAKATLATIAAVLLALTGPPAQAATPTPAPAAADRVTRHLAEHPGGTRVNDNEISYHNGALVITLDPPLGVTGVADCPYGWFCFYDRPSYGYPRGRLSSCGKQNLATWGWQFRTESAHYNLGSGRVVFLYYDIALFQVSAASRGLPDAAPNRNLATHVHRVC